MNPIWKIPLAKLFGEVLLAKNYKKIKTNVLQAIDSCTYLNYVIDEFSNINHKQIINFSVHTQMAIF